MAEQRTDQIRRADAVRNRDALVASAAVVFASRGVDAPVKLISDHAGVGVGTLYRHFPTRPDLARAVYRREALAAARAADELRADQEPVAALTAWLRRFVDLLAIKRGLMDMLYAEPLDDTLQDFFDQNVTPALRALLDAGRDAGVLTAEVEPMDIILAISAVSGLGDLALTHRHIDLLVSGLRA